MPMVYKAGTKFCTFIAKQAINIYNHIIITYIKCYYQSILLYLPTKTFLILQPVKQIGDDYYSLKYFFEVTKNRCTMIEYSRDVTKPGLNHASFTT